MNKSQLLFFGLLLILVTSNFVNAQELTHVYFFYGEGCPHCAEEQIFLNEIEGKYNLNINKYEIYYNQTGRDLYSKFAKTYNSSTSGVPRTIISDKIFIGFTKEDGQLTYNSVYGGFIGYKNVLESQIKYCSEYGCLDPIDILSEKIEIKEVNYTSNTTLDIETVRESVNFPFIGKIYLDQLSLPALTIVLGLLDGFNPCAMFVLSFLLAFLIATKSRKRVFLIGFIFLFISGLVYFLFISAWFNFFLFFKYITFLKWAVAILVSLAGLVNIKDFFFFQKGISLTLPKKWKPKLMDKMKNLSTASGLWIIIGGVITVALVVNVVELMCTLGFPLIYTQILSTYQLPRFTYSIYILFYCVLYMIDDLILFAVAVIALRTIGMDQKRVRIMKLISGIIMLVLSVWFVMG